MNTRSQESGAQPLVAEGEGAQALSPVSDLQRSIACGYCGARGVTKAGKTCGACDGFGWVRPAGPSEEGVSQANDGAVNGVTHQDAQDSGPSPMYGELVDASFEPGEPIQLRKRSATPVDDMTGQFLVAIADELVRARTFWPGNRVQLATVSEKLGQLAQELLRLDYTTLGDPTKVWRRAVQVAAMAARVATEGDSSFGYRPVCGAPVPPKAANLPA